MSTQAEILGAIIGAFPPGVQEALADDSRPDGDVTRHLRAIAGTVVDSALATLDMLSADVSPLTCGKERMADWERALGLAQTRTALFGNLESRRKAVISRLREYGPPTKAMLQSVLAPLLGYADPTQLVILECDRTELRTRHTYAGSMLRSGFDVVLPAIWAFWVNDDDRVASGCPQADITLTTAADVRNIAVDIQTPDGAYFRVPYGAVGRGAAAGKQFRLYWPTAATAHVVGEWRLYVYLTGPGSGTLDDASLFVEGFGRSGLASAKFEWAAVFEPSKSTSPPDFDAARAAADRISLASRIGGLVFPASPAVGLVPTDWAWIPNDNAIPSGMVPG